MVTGTVVVSFPLVSVAVAVRALVPKPSGTVALQFLKPSVDVAGIKFTVTDETGAETPELVPCTVTLESAVENPEAGLVRARLGAVTALAFAAQMAVSRSGNGKLRRFRRASYTGET